MAETTIEALAKRLEELERKVAAIAPSAPPSDWRSVVGLFDGSDFMKRVIEEGQAIRQADRDAA